MKNLILMGLILVSLTLSTCMKPQYCVVCDIYDEYGDWVKDYGEFCGSSYNVDEYAADADDHAYKYYNGWAECYFD